MQNMDPVVFTGSLYGTVFGVSLFFNGKTAVPFPADRLQDIS